MKLKAKDVALALNETGAIVFDAAGKLGVSRTALYKFLEAHPELKELRAEIEEELIDAAESHIVKAILAGDMKTVRWYMERKGKNRGYNTRVEQTGADGGPLEYNAVERRIHDHTNEC